MTPHFFGSVTRNAHLDERPFTVSPTPRATWREGDYVVGRVAGTSREPYGLEVPSGRIVEVFPGDLVVGALGTRAATLAVVGTWTGIGDDLAMDALSMAGVLGKCSSASLLAQRIMPLSYAGHVHLDDRPARMQDVALPGASADYRTPTVLIVGTSMDAGKTMAARQLTRILEERGLRVAATKLTGVARYRDVLSMGDAGATWICDFVDAGLPSTVVPRAEYVERLRALLAHIAGLDPDVVVAESGASPLEPYNGDTAIEELGDAVRCTVLCASDPYAVEGVMSAFGSKPDIVSGRAVSTTAGSDLVERLTGMQGLNIVDPRARDDLVRVLETTLDLPPAS